MPTEYQILEVDKLQAGDRVMEVSDGALIYHREEPVGMNGHVVMCPVFSLIGQPKLKVGRYVEVEYGPKDPEYHSLGKFQCEYDERIYQLTLDGCCESVGEAEFTGWFAKVPLTDEDHEYLKTDTFPEMFEPNTNRRPVGAIVEVVNSGAVYVSYYYTDVDFDSVWGQICDDVNSHYDDEGDFIG